MARGARAEKKNPLDFGQGSAYLTGSGKKKISTGDVEPFLGYVP